MNFRRFMTVLFMIGAAASSCCADQGQPRIYVRVKLLQASPADVPVQIGLSVFDTFREFPWVTFGKYGISKTSGRVDFSSEFEALLPWEQLGQADQFHPGDVSPWIEVSSAVYADNPDKGNRMTAGRTFAFSFNTPTRPTLKGAAPLPRPKRMGFKGDCGNLDGVSATIEFADAPNEDRILKSVTYDSGISVIAIVANGVSDGVSQPRPLSDWAGSVQTVYDAVCRQIEELKRRGVQQEMICERFVTSTWIHHGYHFNLFDTKTALKQAQWVRMMGINYCNWFITIPPGINTDTMPAGVSVYEWVAPMGPQWVSDDPWAPDFKQKVASNIALYIETWKQEVGYKPGSRIWCKIGDEVKLISEEVIINSPSSQIAFRGWLSARGVVPSDLGCKSYDQVLPISKDSVKDGFSAKVYYYTCLFRQDATAGWWQDYVDAIREAFGTPIQIGTESCGISYDAWPDYFLWSRMGFMDHMIHEYTTKLWVPSHYAIALADKHRSVAKFGNEQSGGLLAPGRTATPVGVELTGTTALMRGMQNLHIYDYYLDEPWHWDVQAATAKLLQRAARLEDYILDGQSPTNEARCAVLHSPVWEIWRGAGYAPQPTTTLAGGWLAEKNLLATSLALQQVPYDFLPTDEIDRLGDYKVLYITDPNVPQDAQKAIIDWVRAGGVLFTVAEAAARNEFNDPASIIDELSGSVQSTSMTNKSPSAWGEYSEEVYTFKPLDSVEWLSDNMQIQFEAVARKETINIPGSSVLARYRDGSPAAVSFRAGEGLAVHVGTSPAAALARTAAESFQNDIAHLREPSLQIDQRHLDPGIMKLYLYPANLAGIQRKLVISKSGVDATFYETPDGAVVIMADYDLPRLKNVTVDAKFSFDYETCTTEAGAVLPVVHKDGRTIIPNVELGTSEVLFLK
jgi:hypothetical protein